MPIMTIRKIHPSGLKIRWIGKFSTMPKSILGKRFLNHHCLSVHDHFGEFLVGFAHSTKS
jgi:hypothetical protein